MMRLSQTIASIAYLLIIGSLPILGCKSPSKVNSPIPERPTDVFEAAGTHCGAYCQYYTRNHGIRRIWLESTGDTQEQAWRTLGYSCEEVNQVGKTQKLLSPGFDQSNHEFFEGTPELACEVLYKRKVNSELHPDPRQVVTFSDHFKFVITQLKPGSAFNFRVSVFERASGAPRVLDRLDISLRWNNSTLEEKLNPDRESRNAFLFRMTRGKYCWDGKFNLTLRSTDSDAVEKTSFSVTELCEPNP